VFASMFVSVSVSASASASVSVSVSVFVSVRVCNPINIHIHPYIYRHTFPQSKFSESDHCRYRVAKMHRMPYVYRSFSAKEPYF